MIFHPSYSEKPNIMPIFHKDSTSEGALFCLLNLGMGPENWCTFYHEDDELAIFVLVFQNVLITDQKLNNNDWKDDPLWDPDAMQASIAQILWWVAACFQSLRPPA